MSFTIDKGSCRYCITQTMPGHKILECQYRRSMYCPVCIAYGHAQGDCPNKIAWALRQGKPIQNLENLVLIVEITENTDKAVKEGIKKLLEVHGIEHSAPSILEYRKKLRDFANSIQPPRLVQFIVRCK
uniref:Uncharacterized protein n=1 Tax=viral metagenome TaxID=1070528 RepID=A0A6C0KQ27_9ZZZZ